MAKRKTSPAWGSIIGTAAGCALLIGYSPAAARGAQIGIVACGEVILPAIFPFLVLSVYVAGSPAGATAAALLGRVAARCYSLPLQAASALLLSWIGGYPAGAKALAELEEQGNISRQDAAYGACVCINSGPAFMAGAVGARLFGSIWVGIFLFLCQLTAGLLMTRILALLLKRPPQKQKNHAVQQKQCYSGFAPQLVHAVTSAAGAAVNICAFVILLSAVAEALFSCGFFPLLSRALQWVSAGYLAGDTADCVLTGMLEICAGCARASSLSPTEAAKILPFLLSFGGCSVWCQVAACFGGRGISWGKLILSRLLHGVLTALLAAPWLKACAAALAMGGEAVLITSGGELIWGSVWMLLLLVMLAVRCEKGMLWQAANRLEKTP